MEQLGPSLLELGAETHDELIHTTRLIMTMAMGAGLRAGEELSRMYIAVGRCECVNLTSDPIKTVVEPVDSVLPLLKTTKGLVQGVDLCLTGAAVAAIWILPHLTCSVKICNLRADLKSDSLADDHLGRGVVTPDQIRVLI